MENSKIGTCDVETPQLYRSEFLPNYFLIVTAYESIYILC